MSSKIQKPRFQLERVYDDGSREEPELHSLDGIDADCRMGRRGFLLTSAVGAGALAALLSGCASGSAQSRGDKPTGSKAPAPPRIYAPNIHGLTAHGRTVHSLIFSSDSKTLFTAGSDDKVKFWSIPEGKLQGTVVGSKLVSIALDANDKILVTGIFGGLLRPWPAPFVKADKEMGTLKNILDIALGPDGKTLAVATQKGIQLHSFPSGNVLATLAQEENVSRIAFSPDGSMLAGSIASTKETLLWSVPSGNLLARWSFPAERMVFNADGTLLVAAKHRGVTQLSHTPSGDRENMLGEKQNHIPLAFSPDAKWLAVQSRPSTVLLFSAPFSEPALSIEGHEKDVFAAAFSRDNRFLAVGTTKGSVYVWELNGSEETPCALQAILYDADSMQKGVSAQQAITSEKSVFIGRCGDPLPPGAVCTCNCVAGRAPAAGTICTCNTVVTCTCNTVPVQRATPSRGRSGGTYCRCDRICTCVPVK